MRPWACDHCSRVLCARSWFLGRSRNEVKVCAKLVYERAVLRHKKLQRIMRLILILDQKVVRHKGSIMPECTGAMSFDARSKGGKGGRARPTHEVFVTKLFEVFTREQIGESCSKRLMAALIKSNSKFEYNFSKKDWREQLEMIGKKLGVDSSSYVRKNQWG